MGFGLYPGFGLQPDAASALRVVTEPFSLACREFGFVFVETPRRMSAQQFCLQPVRVMMMRLLPGLSLVHFPIKVPVCLRWCRGVLDAVTLDLGLGFEPLPEDLRSCPQEVRQDSSPE